jgi:hypothetical protein
MGQYMLGTGVTITETFLLDGVATDPSNVTFYVRDPQDTLTTYVFGVDAELTNPAVGVYQLAIVPTIPGHYNYRAEGTGTVVAACEGDFDVLPSPTLTIDVVGTEVGPCTAWIDAADVAACCDADIGTDFVLFESAAVQASQFLHQLSGRQFTGSCRKTVRPCTDRWCDFQVLSRGHIINGGGWGPTGWGWGQTGWNWPSFSGCGCQPLSRILLSGYPVTSIVSVRIDGDLVDDTTYRLDEHRYLTRVRDPLDPDTALTWPSCQMLDLADTEDGTFSVTYMHGADPPALGEAAAAQLACQFYKACTGDGDCLLPAGTTRATRQGITVEKEVALAWFFNRQNGGWSTGMSLVDAFLSAYNPSGLARRPIFWSPSGPQYARPIG